MKHFLSLLLLTSALTAADLNVPVRDLVGLDNGPVNYVFGYGLVVGLDGSGDSRQALFAQQSLKSMLRRLGVELGEAQFQTKNVAGVMLTASLRPFGRAGDAVDLTVSALGDCRSLHGGMLLQTPLQDAAGSVRAIAQGPLSIGGFNVQSGGGSVQKNHATVGRVPNGAVLTNHVEGVVAPGGIVSLRLLNPDYGTAIRIADAIKDAFGLEAAAVMDPQRVTVRVPLEYLGRETLFVARLEALRVRPDQRARVVINERTGTVVVNGNVRLLPVAIAHGGLRIEVSTTPLISQPGPFTDGSNASTVVVPDTAMNVEEEQKQLALLEAGDSVQDLVKVLNALQVTPRDLIAIMQALKEAGALLAELETM
ncbi:MAG: flagellar basal body P-ring protein FlgI [Fimbriimonadaceae bacterium]|nr:flagellar basal body P-ring protein FlgI [Fimbriimonadaceae bacterium]